jgi:PAS domain S-box-containing protein
MPDSFMPRNSAVPFGSDPALPRLAFFLLLLSGAAVWFSSRAMQSADFLPHWYCFAGNSRLLWTTAIADFTIGFSYVLISGTLLWILRRSGADLPYQGFFWAFGLFIVSCGITHFIEILTIWKPLYWLAGAAKILTAVASAGTAIALLVAATDVISFVRAARNVASGRGQERFHALFVATPLAVISFDLAGNVTSWNPAAEKIFGFPEIDTLGKLNPSIPYELVREHQRLLKNTLNGSITAGFETVRVRKDGTHISVSISAAPLFGDGDQQIGVMATLEDISDRKRMESELREKSATLLTVTHALNVYLETGDWSLASIELLTYAIKQTGSELGYLCVLLDDSRLRVLSNEGTVHDELIFQNSGSAAPETEFSRAPCSSQYLNKLFSEVVFSSHTVICNEDLIEQFPNGSSTNQPPLESFLGVPIYKGNEVAGLIAVANRRSGYSGNEWGALETMSRATGMLYDNYRQALKRAALEEKQSALEAHLRQSQNLDALARVAGGFAHDFNNLLMILSGASELLDRSLGAESLSRVYIDQIQQSTDKAAAITHQLLAFSRKQVLDLHPMDLHAALSQSRTLLPHLLGPDIQISFAPNAFHSWINSDLPQIGQVILNLCSNSRYAMPAGGCITISTENSTSPPSAAPPSATEIVEWVVLEIRDTGIGMDQQTLAQIFEPFFSTKPVGKGTGLGLSTVYGVVRQSGGFIDVQSRPGEGTTFKIYFPAISSVPASSHLIPSSTTTPLSEHATILLVDDETALVHAIGEFLRDSGYIVLDAFSSQDALDLAREHPGRIDVLLSDVVMPGLRGPELHTQILAIQPGIHVIFMSGYAEGLPEMKLPANALFIQKPFRFSTLTTMLRQLKLSN